MKIFKSLHLHSLYLSGLFFTCNPSSYEIENRSVLDSTYITSISLPDSINHLFIQHGEVCTSGESEEYIESLYYPNLDSSFITPILLKKYPNLKIIKNNPEDIVKGYYRIELWANSNNEGNVSFQETSIHQNHYHTRYKYFKMDKEKWLLDSIANEL